MWGNLSNVRSMAAKIGNVVAPPPDGEEYGEDEEDYEEYEEDEYEEYSDEDDEEEEKAYNGPKSPFGLVNMLTQAMDSAQKRDTDRQSYVEEEEEDFNEHGEVAYENGYEQSVDAVAQAGINELEPVIEEKDSMEDSFTTTTTTPSTSKEIPESNGHPNQSTAPSIPNPSNDFPPTSPTQPTVDALPNVDSPPPSSSPCDPSPLPRKIALVRESGSLSPRPNRKHLRMPVGDEKGDHEINAVGRPQGSTPSGEKISLTPLQDVITTSETPPPVDLAHTSPTVVKASQVEASSIEQVVEAPPLASPQRSLSDSRRMELLEKRCKDLKRQLEEAQQKSAVEVPNGTKGMEPEERQQLLQSFQEKEARLLQAASEEHQQELSALQTTTNDSIAAIQRQLVEERNGFAADRSQLQAMLTEATAQIEQLQSQLHEQREQYQQNTAVLEQNHTRALRLTEDRIAQSMAAVDDREEIVASLRRKIQTLESKMKEHRVGAEEADDEIDELHNENEALHGQLETLQQECERLRTRVSTLESEEGELIHLKVRLADADFTTLF